jgi:hypothetical protein
VFAKIENKVVNLNDFYISREISIALKQWLEQTNEEVNEVFLERNGLKDGGLANIFAGLKDRKLKSLSLINNELGFQSKEHLEKFFKNLTYLRLNELKGPPLILQQTIPSMLTASQLTKLTISGNNLSHKTTFESLLEFFSYS